MNWNLYTKWGVVARVALNCFVALGIALSSYAAEGNTAPASQVHATTEQSRDPGTLSFDDLVALAATPKPEGDLARRLDVLLNTPFVHRASTTTDIQPRRPSVQLARTRLRSAGPCGVI